MADTQRSADVRNRVERTGGHDRYSGGRQDRRGRPRGSGVGGRGALHMQPHHTHYRPHFSDAKNREDHYGIKMQGATAECDICCRKSDLFAIGACLHPICMECGIRLRILGKNEACPKCRATIEKMCFMMYTGDWPSDIADLPNSVPHKDVDRYKICFASEYAAKCYNNYLAHSCPICKKKGEAREFPTFAALNQHVYMVHRFQYCDICVEHVDFLSHERRVYSQLDLERHLNKGDVDDSSQKGHPQCLFCEKRFLDEEHRYKHLRKEHFFCQICDADGISNYFFPTHGELIKHYRKKHVICEEGECKQLGIAFRTEMELKMHKCSHHAAGKQRLNLDFHYDRGTQGGGARGGARHNAPAPAPHVPRIGLIPNENPREPARIPPESVVIVPSMEAQGIDVSLRYSRSGPFTMQGNDFPRLGAAMKQQSKKPAKDGADSSVPSTQKKPDKENADSADAVHNGSTAGTSWFIDDDEAVANASRLAAEKRMRLAAEQEASASVGQRQPNAKTEVAAEGPETAAVASSKASYSAAMFRRPNSLSNIAATLTSNDANAFPSLPPAAKPVKNLPANSAWSKNNLHFPKKDNASQIVGCIVPKKPDDGSKMVSCAAPQGGWRRPEPKQLPEPDLWPRQSVPSNWEEIEDEMGEKMKKKQKATFGYTKVKSAEKPAGLVVNETADKKRRGKKEKAKAEKQQNQQLEMSSGSGSAPVGTSSKESSDSDEMQLSAAAEGKKNTDSGAALFSSVAASERNVAELSEASAFADSATDAFPPLLESTASAVEEPSNAKPAPSFTEMISSKFASIFGTLSAPSHSEAELRDGTSSSDAVFKVGRSTDSTVSNKENVREASQGSVNGFDIDRDPPRSEERRPGGIISFRLPETASAVQSDPVAPLPPPPGMEISSSRVQPVVPPPPGFGPPPGFESFGSS